MDLNLAWSMSERREASPDNANSSKTEDAAPLEVKTARSRSTF
jgi:hypothetical protein